MMLRRIETTTPKPDKNTLRALKQERRAIIIRWEKNLLNWFLYVLIAIVFIAPMVWVFGNSFRSSQSIWRNVYPITIKTFLPLDEFSFFNYFDALGINKSTGGAGFSLFHPLLISIACSVTVVIFSLIFNTGAAYFFGRLRFPGKNLLMIYVIATMMIPQQVILVPMFLVVRQLGFINSFWALVIPWYASPLITFALTQFFKDVPYELDEAATIDGANLFQILIHVIIPNVLTGLLTVTILEFQFIWNEFYWPLIAVYAKNLMTIQVAIASLFTDRDPEWGRVFAAMVIASLPTILLFMFMQRYFYESVVRTGMKG